MIAKIKVVKEVNIKSVRIEAAVRYDEEDIPNDFPLRNGDMWNAVVDIDTGIIRDWPAGKSGELHMKVVDEGSYYLMDEKDEVILSIESNYVPNSLIPGKYGNYIHLIIDETGKITNWPNHPSIEDFTDLEDND